MQSRLDIRALILQGEVERTSIEVDYAQPLADNFEENPRLGFALPFIKDIVEKRYPAIQPGARYQEPTLLFELVVQEVEITPDEVRPNTAVLRVTALLVG